MALSRCTANINHETDAMRFYQKLFYLIFVAIFLPVAIIWRASERIFREARATAKLVWHDTKSEIESVKPWWPSENEK